MYTLFFNELSWISVHFNESEAMKFYSLDEIELGPSWIWLQQRMKLGPLWMDTSSSILELEFNLNNVYIPIEDEIIGMLDERDDAVDNKPIEEVHIVWISNVMVYRIRFKDVEIAILTWKQFLEQKPTFVTPLI